MNRATEVLRQVRVHTAIRENGSYTRGFYPDDHTLTPAQAKEIEILNAHWDSSTLNDNEAAASAANVVENSLARRSCIN